MSPIADRSTLRLVADALERKDRVRLALSLALILVGTLLEMASLSLTNMIQYSEQENTSIFHPLHFRLTP